MCYASTGHSHCKYNLKYDSDFFITISCMLFVYQLTTIFYFSGLLDYIFLLIFVYINCYGTSCEHWKHIK